MSIPMLPAAPSDPAPVVCVRLNRNGTQAIEEFRVILRLKLPSHLLKHLHRGYLSAWAHHVRPVPPCQSAHPHAAGRA